MVSAFAVIIVRQFTALGMILFGHFVHALVIFRQLKGRLQTIFFQSNCSFSLLSCSSLVIRPLPDFISQPWSEIKSGSGLGTRLVVFMLRFDSCELLCLLSLFYYESRCVKYWMFNIVRIAYYTVLKTLTALIHLQNSQ